MEYVMKKTNAGLALEQRLMGKGISLKLVRAESGKGLVSEAQLPLLTEVTEPAQELQLKDLIYPGTGTTLTIPVGLSNRGLTEGYSLYQIGVYAEDTDTEAGEVLYLIAQITREGGEAIPAEANAPGFAVDWNMEVTTANAETVEVVVSEVGRLTIDQADNRYSRKEQQVTTTLTASTWNPETKTYSFEETYPSETYNLNIEPIDCTQEQAEAWGAVLPMGSSCSNVLTALGDVPAVDIPVLLTIKRK